ncbi:MAG: glycosyltransferase family 2 protein [Eubacteriales bacterium]|nr:glycosyltransferase family 2 protein [Eubacteriales bacterium]
MERSGRVSVIVPVYNSGQWLEQCLNSIIGQTYQKLEIIVVDDGSTDHSFNLCRRYAERDRRVQVYRKANGGVSSARNYGLRHATGDWVMFVDADDWLECEAVEAAAAEMVSGGDFCFCNHYLHYKETKKEGPWLYISTITKEEWYCAVISGWKGDFCLGNYIRAIGGKLFDLRIIRENEIQFREDLYIGEDALFILQYLRFVKAPRALARASYNYRITEDSAVRRYKTDLREQLVLQFEGIRELIGKEGLGDSSYLQTALAIFAWGSFNLLIHNGRLMPKGQRDKAELCREAVWWKDRYGRYMKCPAAARKQTPRFIRLECALAGWLPVSALCCVGIAHDRWKEGRK